MLIYVKPLMLDLKKVFCWCVDRYNSKGKWIDTRYCKTEDEAQKVKKELKKCKKM